jgi:hypothetical protein
LNTEIYTNLLAHPQKIGRDEIALLATVIEKYPYFQSARALQLKALKETNSFLYNDSLKRTAAHTTNRDILFEYITSNSFIQNNNSQDIVGHDPVKNEIDVTSKDVSKAVSIEIDAKIKEELKKAEAVLHPDLFERKINSISSIAQRSEDELEGTEASEDKKPLEFRKNDTHSFSEWLQLTKAKPIDRSDNVKISATSQKTATETTSNTSNKRQRDEKLIEKFIQDKPTLISKGRSSNKKDIQQQSEIPATSYNQAPEALMTETLAKVYLQQKNYLKAIKAYEILILKYPEKSGFFADQIRAIEKLTNTEE